MSYCLSTTTAGQSIQVIVPVTGTLNVVDPAGNPYYGVSCDSSTSTPIVQTVDNPVIDLGIGFILLWISLYFFIWLFRKR